MILSALPVSKAMLGIGTAGVVGVTAAGVGIYKLASNSAESRSMPKCRIFFYEGGWKVKKHLKKLL